MSAKHGGPEALCLIDGYDFLSSKPKTMSLKHEELTEQTDGLGDNFEAHSPVGKARFTFMQGGGFFDTLTAGLHAAMMKVATGAAVTPQAVPRIGVFGAMTQAVGSLFYGIQGTLTPLYEVLFENSKLTKANVSYLLDGKVEPGMVVQPLATKTADWNTKSLGTVVDYTLDPSQIAVPITSATKASPCVVTTTIPHGLTTGDIILTSGNTLAGPSINSEQAVTVLSTTTYSVAVNTSASTGAGTGGSFVRCNTRNGGAGYQQVKTLTGFTNFVGKLRDSADDTTYGDLITFADVTDATDTTLTAQRLTNVADTVVDRYLSYDGNVTGSGSITAFAGFARL